MNLSTIRIEKPEAINFILGHAHFIKTVEDLYEAIVQTNPAMGHAAAGGRRQRGHAHASHRG